MNVVKAEIYTVLLKITTSHTFLICCLTTCYKRKHRNKTTKGKTNILKNPFNFTFLKC